MWDAIYNLSIADESIYPEKYVVEGLPPIRDFPASHPNKRPAAAASDTATAELKKEL